MRVDDVVRQLRDLVRQGRAESASLSFYVTREQVKVEAGACTPTHRHGDLYIHAEPELFDSRVAPLGATALQLVANVRRAVEEEPSGLRPKGPPKAKPTPIPVRGRLGGDR